LFKMLRKLRGKKIIIKKRDGIVRNSMWRGRLKIRGKKNRISRRKSRSFSRREIRN